MFRSTVVLLLGLSLTLVACGPPDPEYDHKQHFQDFAFNAEYTAKHKIKDQVRDPESTIFRNLGSHVDAGQPVVCGELNTRNGFGGMVGYQHFVWRPDRTLFETVDTADFATVWNGICGSTREPSNAEIVAASKVLDAAL